MKNMVIIVELFRRYYRNILHPLLCKGKDRCYLYDIKYYRLRYFMYYGMISNKLGYIIHLRYLPTGNELQYMYLQYYRPVKTTIRVLTVPTYFGLRYLKILLENTYGIIPTKINNFTNKYPTQIVFRN
jgi:hypothetical protein